jgi:hypothetical protein
MGAFTLLLGLPVAGPLAGLGWLARRIAEAADREMADPARIEAALAALGQELDSGLIDEAAYEAREAELLAELDSLAAQTAPDEAAP